MDTRFRTLSPATPKAVERAWSAAIALQGPGIGDYYEFGVFRGYTLLQAQLSVDRLGIDGVRFWGFDSFQGLPAVVGADAAEGQFFEGQFACPRSQVEDAIARHGGDLSRIALVEGYYGDSLTAHLKAARKFRPVGVALLDCDLYSSTREVLDWLDSLLQENSILLFDDWKTFGTRDDRGQPRAFREFLDRGRWQAEPFGEFGRHGSSFILKRAH